MFKYAMLAGAVMLAAPVLAQGAPMSTQASPSGVTAGAPQQPAAPTDAVPMQPAVREQPATADQVAQLVDAEFPGYDKNGDGTLSATEFGAWMVALKSKTDPTTKPDAPQTKKWIAAAFAQADTDRSKSLTKTELTGFLSKG